MSDVSDLLNEADDETLCDGVFCAFADLNNEIDVASYEEPERVVTLVWHAIGIIGNGGLRYLFEGDLNGDPGFIYTAAAFKSIGAHECYQAFQEVIGCFPDGRLPSDVRVRLDRFESIPKCRRDRINERFWTHSREVPSLLAKYIRDRRGDFERVLGQTCHDNRAQS